MNDRYLRPTDRRVFRPESEGRGFLPGHDRACRDEAYLDIHLVRTVRGQATADLARRYVCHSPDGFEWGYAGSGPADLALNVLGQFLRAPEAWRLHQAYKRDVIARLAYAGPHTITAQSVRAWIVDQWHAEALDENATRTASVPA